MSDNPIKDSFAPVRLLGDSDDVSPRVFVELWDTAPWSDVVSHLATLPGVTDIVVREAVPDEPGLTFSYEGHAFSFYRAGGDYVGVVAIACCPDDILLSVANHLNCLLCRITSFPM